MNLQITNKKLILISLFTILIFTIGAIVVRLVLLAPGVDIQNEVVSYTTSYGLSYPVSYSILNDNSELIPLNAESLSKSINTRQFCLDNQTTNSANLGIVTYGYSTGNFSTHDQDMKNLIINNKNTVRGENEEKDFAEVIDYIENKKNLTSLNDLHAFRYACTGGASSYYITSYEIDYPSVDKSLAYIFVGGTQYAWINITDVKFTIKILAYKGDNVMQLSEYFEGSKLFTQEEVAACTTTAQAGYDYLSMDCIGNMYLQSKPAQDKVMQITKDLISFFEFK